MLDRRSRSRTLWLALPLLLLLPASQAGSVPEAAACSGEDADACLLRAEVARLAEIQTRHQRAIVALPGAFAIGIGLDESGRRPLFVVSLDETQPSPDVPVEIEGVPVRVVYRAPIELHHGAPNCAGACHADQTSLPVQMGNSAGGILDCSACTMGFKACDQGTGEMVYVTNSHCARDASGCEGTAPLGMNMQHPGPLDFPSCWFGGPFIGTVTGHAQPFCGDPNNYTDASKIDSDSSQTTIEFRDIGFPIAQQGNPVLGMQVQKSGRTTGLTFGVITQVNMLIQVPQQNVTGQAGAFLRWGAGDRSIRRWGCRAASGEGRSRSTASTAAG